MNPSRGWILTLWQWANGQQTPKCIINISHSSKEWVLRRDHDYSNFDASLSALSPVMQTGSCSLRLPTASTPLAFVSFDLYSKEDKFSWDSVKDTKGFSEDSQWLFIMCGGVGPMRGQANYSTYTLLKKCASRSFPYTINCYLNEAKRLYGVLKSRVSKQDYLIDNSYGIADIKTFACVHVAPRTGIDLSEFPNLMKWVDRIKARSAVNAGLAVP